MVTFHKAWFVPNNALLAIVGDLTADEAFAAADRAFGKWTRRDVPTAKVADPPPPTPRVVVIDRPGRRRPKSGSATSRFRAPHPDFIPFDMAIRILGGEGANRLFGVLRSDRGLTYGASATFHTFRTAGDVVAETDTRSATTGESLRLMVDEFWRLPARGRASGRAPRRAGLHVRALSAVDRIAVGDRRTGAGAAVLRPRPARRSKPYLSKVELVTPGEIQRGRQAVPQAGRADDCARRRRVDVRQSAQGRSASPTSSASRCQSSISIPRRCAASASVPRVMISCGEASGDLYAAALLASCDRSIHTSRPSGSAASGCSAPAPS
jgi:zinc protease